MISDQGYSPDYFRPAEEDDRAWHDMMDELHEKSVEALWWAMQSVPEDCFEHLCQQCGVKREEVEQYERDSRTSRLF